MTEWLTDSKEWFSTLAAYVGAFLGICNTGCSLYKHFTDRPIVKVSCRDSVVDKGLSCHKIEVFVYNAGKRDATLTEVGFLLFGRINSYSVREDSGPKKLPRRLCAGDEFSYSFRTGKDTIDYDKIVRPFARLAGDVIVKGMRLKHW